MTVKEYDVPLRLVSPHMTGIPVRDAQYLMKGHSRFDGLAPYKDGKLDSDYGTLTAQATRRAKFWLGYPETALDGIFGQTLYEYLRIEHWRPLPEPYQKRRADRLKAAASNPGSRALAAALAQIGYREEPSHGVNDNKFGREYGFNRVPWCAIFESIMFKHTGRPSFRYAAVEMIYWDAASGRNGLYLVRTPRPGDVIGYRLHGDSFAHTAFYVRDLGGGQIEDLGGNTGPSNISNGGMVMKQPRDKSVVHFYARVG